MCFHSQQSVEKLLKSAIPTENRPRSHKLADLLGLIPSSIGLADETKRMIRRLDRFYIPTRYPDALPGSFEDGLPTKADASEAIQTARELFAIIGNP